MSDEKTTDDAGVYDENESGSMPHFDVPTGSDAASDLVHIVPEPGKVTATAKALLDAAGEDREHEVRSADGGFDVPADIADAVDLASIETDSDATEDDGEETPGDEQPDATPRRRPAAKKTAARRPAKKTAARSRS